MTKSRLSMRHMRAAICALLVVLVAGMVAAPAMAKKTSKHRHGPNHSNGLSISSSSFGNLPDTAPANAGAAVTKYTLTNGRGMSVSILDYGGSHPVAERPRQARPRDQRHPRLRRHRRLHQRRVRQEQPVLRRDHRPLRQPHRPGGRPGRAASGIRARRQHLHARREQRRRQPSRRQRRLRQAHVGRHDDPGERQHRRAEAVPPQPGRRRLHDPGDVHGVPRRRRRVGHLHAGQPQQPALRLRGDDHRADRPQPHQPLLLEPGR